MEKTVVLPTKPISVTMQRMNRMDQLRDGLWALSKKRGGSIEDMIDPIPDLTSGAVRKFLRGDSKSMTFNNIDKIATHTQVTIGELFGEDAPDATLNPDKIAEATRAVMEQAERFKNYDFSSAQIGRSVASTYAELITGGDAAATAAIVMRHETVTAG